MKNKTDKEIMDFLDKLHGKGWDLEPDPEEEEADLVETVICNNYPYSITIHFQGSYGLSPPPVNLMVLMAYADFFDTMEINDTDHYHEAGCETCDYGSYDSYTLAIRPD